MSEVNWVALQDACGFIQDSSCLSLRVEPDEATGRWAVFIGGRFVGQGVSIRSALVAASVDAGDSHG